jgi:hypothetical protein
VRVAHVLLARVCAGESGGVSRGVYRHSYLMYALYVSLNRLL